MKDESTASRGTGWLRAHCTSCKLALTLSLADPVQKDYHCGGCGKVVLQLRPDGGFVYVLEHPYMPGLVKIGLTRGSADKRAKQLSTTGVPGTFKVAALFPSDEPFPTETRLHGLLQQYRVTDDREFFRLAVREAIERIAGELQIKPSFVSPLYRLQDPETASSGSSADAEGQLDIHVPQLGESISFATITRFLVELGDVVKANQPVFEIGTDKVDAEIPSPVSGVVIKFRASVGQRLPVGSPVITLRSL